MEEIAALVLIWLIHTMLAGVLTLPVVFLSRSQIRWSGWQLVVFILPFAIWASLFFSNLSAGRKSIANLGEPFYFGLAIPLAAFVRVAIDNRINANIVDSLLVAIVCGIAVATFFIVPPWPE